MFIINYTSKVPLFVKTFVNLETDQVLTVYRSSNHLITFTVECCQKCQYKRAWLKYDFLYVDTINYAECIYITIFISSVTQVSSISVIMIE